MAVKTPRPQLPFWLDGPIDNLSHYSILRLVDNEGKFLLIAALKVPIAIPRETRPTASVCLNRNAYFSKYPDVAG